MKMIEDPILHRILEPVGRALLPEVARRLLKRRLDAKSRARIESLAKRCNEGRFNANERSAYESYVSAIDYVALLQAQARAVLA